MADNGFLDFGMGIIGASLCKEDPQRTWLTDQGLESVSKGSIVAYKYGSTYERQKDDGDWQKVIMLTEDEAETWMAGRVAVVIGNDVVIHPQTSIYSYDDCAPVKVHKDDLVLADHLLLKKLGRLAMFGRPPMAPSNDLWGSRLVDTSLVCDVLSAKDMFSAYKQTWLILGFYMGF